MSTQTLVMAANSRSPGVGDGSRHVEMPINRLWLKGLERHAGGLDASAEPMVLKAPAGVEWYEDDEPVGESWSSEVLLHLDGAGQPEIEAIIGTDPYGNEYVTDPVSLATIRDALNGDSALLPANGLSLGTGAPTQ